MYNDCTTPEVWLAIPGYEGHYEVSNCGKVHSLTTYAQAGPHLNRIYPGRPLRLIYRRPYYGVTLSLNGKTRRFAVYQLVALAFLGPRPAGYVAHHLNENPLDDRANNLTYLSKMAHQHVHVSGVRNPNAKLTEELVRQIRSLHKTGEYSVKALAAQFGTGKSAMGAMIRHETWVGVGDE